VHLIQWGELRPGEEFDTDNEEHMRWMFNRAAERAANYGIQVRVYCAVLCGVYWEESGVRIGCYKLYTHLQVFQFYPSEDFS
jgi:hypothetical protein